MKRFVNKKSIILMLGAIALFLYLVNNYSIVALRNIDETMIDWLLANTHYFMVYIFKFITIFANWQLIIFASLILFYFARDKVLAALVTIITGFSYLPD